MMTQSITHGRILSALTIACAMAVFSAQPAAAQSASSLKCTGCVKSKHLKNNSIRSIDIQNGQVKNADLATGAVNSAKIANGAVGFGKLSPGVQDQLNASGTGDITGVTAGDGLSGGGAAGDVSLSVSFGASGTTTAAARSDHTHTGGTIDDGSITSTDLANNAVNGAKIADGTVGAADLAGNAVTSAKIANGAVGNADLAGNAVDSAKVRNNSLTGADVQDDSLTASDLATDSVGASELGSNAVGSANVLDDSLTANDLGPSSVGSDEIAQNAVGSSEVADNSLSVMELSNEAGVDYQGGDQAVALTGTDTVVRSVTITAPSFGQVLVNVSGFFSFDSNGQDFTRCSITKATSIDAANEFYAGERAGINVGMMPFAGTRGFTVFPGSTTFRLVCRNPGGAMSVGDSQMTAIFVPTSY